MPRVVLVVEDDPDTRSVFAQVLTDELGEPVVVARDGPEALELARKHRPAVVVLDIGLPKVDGYEVARRLRADPATARAWIIAATAVGKPDEAGRAGFDQFLWKPLELGHLALAVEGGLDRRSRVG